MPTTKLNEYETPLCKDARFDAIAVISDAIMAFKGFNYTNIILYIKIESLCIYIYYIYIYIYIYIYMNRHNSVALC